MNALSWEALGHIALALSTIISAGSALLIFMLSRSFASSQEMNKMGTRLTVLETITSPSIVGGLNARLNTLEGDMKAVRTALEAIKQDQSHNRETLDKIQSFLLENK